ncbi:MAG: hypothetical protein II917_04690, partial [Synergistaceae bacterium]|nr:hypothetical protein [Synergistaceae bacterium]
SIEELYLSNTDLTEINARGCSRLKTLHFANAKVSKIDLTGCGELTELDFNNNRLRRFHKDDFILDKLEKLDAKGQEAYISLIEKIFDFAAFLLGYDDGEAFSSGTTAQTGDKNLRLVIAYDESGSEINYDASKYPKTGEFIFDKTPAKIVYYYETGLDSMDVAITGIPEGSDNYGDNDNDKPDAGSSGGCNSGLAASLALIGFAFTHRHRKRR